MTTRLIRTIAVIAILVIAPACDDDDDSPTGPSSDAVLFIATLSPANEVPAVSNIESTGSGTAQITFRLNRDSSGTLVSVTVSFAVSLVNFPAGTAVTMAHIHQAPAGSNGSIVIDTGVVAGEVSLPNGVANFTKTGIAVSPDLALQIQANPANFYFNVHSTLNPSGVARGQLVLQ